MDITPLIPQGKNTISSYGPQGFKVNQTFYQNILLLSADKLLNITQAGTEEFWEKDLPKNLEQIIDSASEILLIGTGSRHIALPASLKNRIKTLYPAISISEMSSASAVRTYNILI